MPSGRRLSARLRRVHVRAHRGLRALCQTAPRASNRSVGVEPHHLASIGYSRASCGTAATCPRWPDHPPRSTSWSWLLSYLSSSSSFCSPRFRPGRTAPQEGRGTMSPQLQKEQPRLPPRFPSPPVVKPCTPGPRTTPLNSENCRTDCKTPSIRQPRGRQKNQNLERRIVQATVESGRQLNGVLSRLAEH